MLPTFQDAIKVVRKLVGWFGLGYLWIDALCIIQEQESKVDWLSQGLIMHEICKKSYCNLAACIGADSTSGLLPLRNSFPLHTCYANGRKGTALEGSFQILDSNDFEKSVNSCKLLFRAWVHQEAVLAPRTLYFTQRQIF